jgi:RimJ/RimL family protein N-acetyltransferase
MVWRMATREWDMRTRTALETARLRLEPWDDTHFERFALFMRNADVIRWVRREPLDRDRALELHERSLEEWNLHGFGKRAIIEQETDRWLGFAELSLVGPGKGSRDDDVEIGYFIEPSRWGEGIATEAALELRNEASRTSPRHACSRRSASRCCACSSSRTASSSRSTTSAATSGKATHPGASTSATPRPRMEGGTVRRAERAVVADRQAGVTELYDVVLLAGSPRRVTLRLAPDVVKETAIEVDGEQWTVADVRTVESGPTQLICIYAL